MANELDGLTTQQRIARFVDEGKTEGQEGTNIEAYRSIGKAIDAVLNLPPEKLPEPRGYDNFPNLKTEAGKQFFRDIKEYFNNKTEAIIKIAAASDPAAVAEFTPKEYESVSHHAVIGTVDGKYVIELKPDTRQQYDSSIDDAASVLHHLREAMEKPEFRTNTDVALARRKIDEMFTKVGYEGSHNNQSDLDVKTETHHITPRHIIELAEAGKITDRAPAPNTDAALATPLDKAMAPIEELWRPLTKNSYMESKCAFKNC